MTPEPVRARLATPADLPAALGVWARSNAARGRPPDASRIERVRAKLADPEALLVVAGDGDTVVGMALAEPGRDLDGNGPRLPELCHVSMVFVSPDRWGQRVGAALLDAVAARALERGHRELQLWTRRSNRPAQRLYHRAGFRPTGRARLLPDGEPILHLALAIRPVLPP